MTLNIKPLVSSVRAQVVATIRAEIVQGRLLPGSRLKERELCEELDVSRPTVREALRQLEAEGLVEIRPHKGPVVATLTDDEARDMYEFREALECFAVYLFVQRASDEAVEDLAHAVDLLEEAHRSGTVEEMIEVKNRFYDVLYTGARNKVLHQQVRLLYGRLAGMRARALLRPGRPVASIIEIRAVLEQILARNAGAARDLWRSHVRSAMNNALQPLPTEDSKTASEQVQLQPQLVT